MVDMKDNGGPAFPTDNEQQTGAITYHYEGMKLRDYFAAKAMQAIITKMPIVDQEGEFGRPSSDKAKYNRDVCDSAYVFADAMIEARKS